MEARAKALPEEYRIVYEEIKQYIWKNSGVSTIDVFKSLLELFEDNAADNKKVLEITGNDVAAFCDELVREQKTYTSDWREKLNQTIARKIGK